ncbi:MAG: Rid family hydrolase [Bacteroidota bacterium]
MKTTVKILLAPQPIGPFSHVLIVGKLDYTSAQFDRKPVNGKIITTTIDAETTRVNKKLQSISRTADTNFSEVIKVSILKELTGCINVFCYFRLPFSGSNSSSFGSMPLSSPP